MYNSEYDSPLPKKSEYQIIERERGEEEVGRVELDCIRAHCRHVLKDHTQLHQYVQGTYSTREKT